MDTDGPPPSTVDGSRPAPLHAPVDERQRRAYDAVLGVAGGAGLAVAGAGVWRAGSAVLVGLPSVPALARVDEPARVGRRRPPGRCRRVPWPRPGCRPSGSWALSRSRWPHPSARSRSGAGSRRPARPWGRGRWGQVARLLHDRTRARPLADVPRHDPLSTVAAELDRAEAAGATVGRRSRPPPGGGAPAGGGVARPGRRPARCRGGPRRSPPGQRGAGPSGPRAGRPRAGGVGCGERGRGPAGGGRAPLRRRPGGARGVPRGLRRRSARAGRAWRCWSRPTSCG